EYRAKYNAGKPATRLSVMGDVLSGKLEMCQTYTYYMGNFARPLWSLDLPYLFRDYDHAERVIDGPIGAELRTQLQKSSGLRALAITYSGGESGYATTNLELRRPQDFKGVRFTSSGSPAQIAMAQKLEYEVLPSPAEAFVPLAQKDLADGIVVTSARFEE